MKQLNDPILLEQNHKGHVGEHYRKDKGKRKCNKGNVRPEGNAQKRKHAGQGNIYIKQKPQSKLEFLSQFFLITQQAIQQSF